MEENEVRTIITDIQEFDQENEWVEIKSDNHKPETIGEYISALANGAAYVGQSKGYLIFGMDDKTHELVGTTLKPAQKKIGTQELENWLATLLSPRIDFSIHEITIQEKRIVLFIINAADSIPVKFQGTAWIRVGSCKKKLSDHPERERKIWQNANHQPFESKIAKRSVNVDEVLSLIDYSSAFRLLQFPLSENKNTILEKLENEKIIIKRGTRYDITNLGAILFASNLNDFDILSRKAVRVISYKGNDRLNALKEWGTETGYAVGFEKLVKDLTFILPVSEEIGNALKTETPIYPSIAIREFVANAIIHQDFSITGTSPMIEIFQNRLEITNPGKPLIDTLRFIDHTPISRNEGLAAIMRRMGLCEERGSGVDRALTQCEIYQLPAPDFICGDIFTKVSMFAPKTMRQMNKEDKIRACYQH